MGALVGNDEITVFVLSGELDFDILSRVEANRQWGVSMKISASLIQL